MHDPGAAGAAYADEEARSPDREWGGKTMTPAIRLLQREGVAFTQHPYDHDDDATAFGDEAAAKLGVDPARMFKTLVCQADGVGLVMVLVPVAARLDLKALAKALGVKKADLADAGVA